MSDGVASYLAHLGIEVTEDELAHYGKKGMKWGVRKEDELIGRSSSSAETPQQKQLRAKFEVESARIQKELKARGHTELDSAVLKAKYETPVGKDPEKGLTKKQKTAIGVGIGVVAIAGISYLAYKNGVFDKQSPLASVVDERFSPETLIKRFAEKPASASLFDTKYRAYADTADGLKINWDSDVRLSAGSVLRRVSSTAETQVRDSGFFAAFRDDDVKSYSAILPTFWAKWGVGTPMDGGFINHYQASSEIKAPSGKQTVEMFKEFLSSNKQAADSIGFRPEEYLMGASNNQVGEFLKAYAQGWAGDRVDPFFEHVKSKGFNALIDFNDAGILGKTPLRVIDSSIFNIVKNEVLDFDSMVQAATAWAPELIHYFLGESMSAGVDNYLEHMGIEVGDELKHYGKKGMKWGVRNKTDSGASSSGKWDKLATAMDLPGHRRNPSPEQKKQDRKEFLGIVGIAAIGVGAFVAYNLVTSTAANDAFHAITSKGPKYGTAAQDAAKMASARAKLAAGQKAAAATMAAKGNMKLPKLDPETAKFLKDGPARLLSDQKGWSEALGKSLGKIQAEDAKFISDYIANYVPKALGA